MTENAATSASPTTDEVLPAPSGRLSEGESLGASENTGADDDALAGRLDEGESASAIPEMVTVPGILLLLLAHGTSLYANMVEGVRSGDAGADSWLDTFMEQGSALRLLEPYTVTQHDVDKGLVRLDLAAGDDVYQTTEQLELLLAEAYSALGVKF